MKLNPTFSIVINKIKSDGKYLFDYIVISSDTKLADLFPRDINNKVFGLPSKDFEDFQESDLFSETKFPKKIEDFQVNAEKGINLDAKNNVKYIYYYQQNAVDSDDREYIKYKLKWPITKIWLADDELLINDIAHVHLPDDYHDYDAIIKPKYRMLTYCKKRLKYQYTARKRLDVEIVNDKKRKMEKDKNTKINFLDLCAYEHKGQIFLRIKEKNKEPKTYNENSIIDIKPNYYNGVAIYKPQEKIQLEDLYYLNSFLKQVKFINGHIIFVNDDPTTNMNIAYSVKDNQNCLVEKILRTKETEKEINEIEQILIIYNKENNNFTLKIGAKELPLNEFSILKLSLFTSKQNAEIKFFERAKLKYSTKINPQEKSLIVKDDQIEIIDNNQAPNQVKTL